jgi:hypothetical protein
MNVKTSKIFMALTIMVGLVLLFLNRPFNPYNTTVYCLILMTVVWNRYDSRGKFYKFQIQGPGGLKLALNSSGVELPPKDEGLPAGTEALRPGVYGHTTYVDGTTETKRLDPPVAVGSDTTSDAGV